MNKRLWFAAGFAISLGSTAPAAAQEVTAGWRVSLTSYLWLSKIETNAFSHENGQTIESSADFGDLLEDLSGVFVGKSEVQYKRMGVFADLNYIKLSVEQTTQRPILGPITAEADVATTTLTTAVFYRVAESDRLTVDLLGGLRYVDLDLDLDLQGPGPGLSRGGGESLTDPIVGVRATQRIGARSSLSGYADYGFGGDTTVWQVYAGYNYQWTPKLAASFGYRHFDIGVDTADRSTDVTLSGPLIGLTYRF